MTPLLIATTNRGKAREINAVLAGLPYEVVSLADLKLGAVCREGADSFAENARRKARFYSRLSGMLTLAEDSGLEVEALGGAPGVRSARFSGNGATDAANNRKTLGLLRRHPRRHRRARFVCLIALARDGEILKVVRGVVRGTIAPEERGPHGFGYDPIFYYHPFRKTFGEVPVERKNTVSHRGRALVQIAGFLRKEAGRKRGGDRATVPPRSLSGPLPRRRSSS